MSASTFLSVGKRTPTVGTHATYNAPINLKSLGRNLIESVDLLHAEKYKTRAKNQGDKCRDVPVHGLEDSCC